MMLISNIYTVHIYCTWRILEEAMILGILDYLLTLLLDGFKLLNMIILWIVHLLCTLILLVYDTSHIILEAVSAISFYGNHNYT